MPHRDVKQFFSLSQADEVYPISKRTLWGLIHSGKLPAFRLGRKLILRREDIERLLTATPVQARLDEIVDEVVEEVTRA
jgi:excisionase family DNA binding protein